MLVIDRFEGDWAVIEYQRKTFNLPRGLIPPEAVEGDVITVSVAVDPGATAGLKKEIKALADRLFKE